MHAIPDTADRNPRSARSPLARYACPACGDCRAGIEAEAVVLVNLCANGSLESWHPRVGANNVPLLVDGGAAFCRRCGHCALRTTFELRSVDERGGGCQP